MAAITQVSIASGCSGGSDCRGEEIYPCKSRFRIPKHAIDALKKTDPYEFIDIDRVAVGCIDQSFNDYVILPWNETS
jgi:hypothetical protein